MHNLLYGLLTGLLYGLTRVPLAVAYRLGDRLGDLAYLLLAERRRVVLGNLALAFGEEKSTVERRAIARATFRHFGRHIVDFGRLHNLTRERFTQICTVEGLDHLHTLLARQQGVLALSAHFGSWELAPAVALCFDTPLHVIVRPLDHPVLERIVAAYRRRGGYHTIPKRRAMTESLKALRRGEIVAILMDQSSLRHEGIPVEFFGVKTYTSKGPALIALRAECPVIGVFLIRETEGRHRLILTPELPVRRTGNLAQDIEDTTRLFNELLESYIRRYPDHWFWLHRRWKRRVMPEQQEAL
jgi:KDO2-lipid IV(A) lauroyltransferase